MSPEHRVVVDKSLCFSYAVCVATLPELFELGEDEKSNAVNTQRASLEQIMEAVDGCPVGAISIQDSSGITIYP